MGKEKKAAAKEDLESAGASEGEERRDFLRKMTYVAPVIISFQLGAEEVAAQGQGTSPTPKSKRLKKKGGKKN